ncbi:MAG: hypothetical protein NZ750_01480 [Anaerolineae bacterium]|nr:hypothetical protein [Anaerolineae bacterium]MDW8173256.1 hypothetical protein [Anaerolineae bacterium]
MGSRLYDQIIAQRGSLERLVARIPGFRGYHEKEARRAADTMLRDYLADQVEDLIRDFARVESQLVDKVGLAGMSRTREVKARLQSYADRLRTAAPKYSAMFAHVKIDIDDLERIYAFDEAQLRYINQLGQAVEAVKAAVSSGEDHQQALDALMQVADEAIEAFSLRDDVILKLGESY